MLAASDRARPDEVQIGWAATEKPGIRRGRPETQNAVHAKLRVDNSELSTPILHVPTACPKLARPVWQVLGSPRCSTWALE